MYQLPVLFGNSILILLVCGFSFSVYATPYLWQANSFGNDISIYDLDSFQQVNRLEVGPNPHGIAVPHDNSVVYVSLEKYNHSNGEIVSIDPRNLEIRQRIEVCQEPQNIAVTPDGKWLYVPCYDGYYSVIDTETWQTVKKIYTGGRPHNTLVSSDGRYMSLAPLRRVNGVTVVDVTAGHQVAGFISFGGQVRPLAISKNGRKLFQQVDEVNGFMVADTNQRKVVQVVEHRTSLAWYRHIQHRINGVYQRLGFSKVFRPAHCHGLAVTPDQREVWSTCGSTLSFHDLDAGDFDEIAHIDLDGTGYWLGFSPDSRLGIVALYDRDQVVVVDTFSKKIVKVLATGSGPKRNIVIDLPSDTVAAN